VNHTFSTSFFRRLPVHLKNHILFLYNRGLNPLDPEAIELRKRRTLLRFHPKSQPCRLLIDDKQSVFKLSLQQSLYRSWNHNNESKPVCGDFLIKGFGQPTFLSLSSG